MFQTTKLDSKGIVPRYVSRVTYFLYLALELSLTRTEASKLYLASFFARTLYSLCVPTDRRKTVVGKGLEMWVATAVGPPG
jgi:hypothetical protein